MYASQQFPKYPFIHHGNDRTCDPYFNFNGGPYSSFNRGPDLLYDWENFQYVSQNMLYMNEMKSIWSYPAWSNRVVLKAFETIPQ